MCKPTSKGLSFHTLGIGGDTAETCRPLIEAALNAYDDPDGCCSTRSTRTATALLDAAQIHGYRVAWGQPRPDGTPSFYIWHADAWQVETIRDVLHREGGTEITRSRLAPALARNTRLTA